MLGRAHALGRSVCFDAMESEVGPALARHCPSFDAEDDRTACGTLHRVALDIARLHLTQPSVGHENAPPRASGRALLGAASAHCVFGHGPQARNAELRCADVLGGAERACLHAGDLEGARRARALLDDPANALRGPGQPP